MANYSKITASLSLCLLFHRLDETLDFSRPEPHTSGSKLDRFKPEANKSIDGRARDFESFRYLFDRQ